MNGRVYDPVLGRMLSPDNEVQNPLYSQNYNRYTYCFNNPLRYTDPTGMDSEDDDDDGTTTCSDTGSSDSNSSSNLSDWASAIALNPVIVSASMPDWEKYLYANTTNITDFGNGSNSGDIGSSTDSYSWNNYDNNFKSQTNGGNNSILNQANLGVSAVNLAAGAAQTFTAANADAQISYTTINGATNVVSAAKVLDICKSAGYVTFGVILMIFNIIYFRKKFQKIESKYQNEAKSRRTIGYVVYSIYVIGTFVLFFSITCWVHSRT